jgi:hypothetical protein
MTTLLVILAAVCIVWAVVASVFIAKDLEKRGFSVSFLWLRAMILTYLGQYRKATLAGTGHVGPLFYHYVVPLNVALLLAIILIVRELGR